MVYFLCVYSWDGKKDVYVTHDWSSTRTHDKCGIFVFSTLKMKTKYYLNVRIHDLVTTLDCALLVPVLLSFLTFAIHGGFWHH